MNNDCHYQLPSMSQHWRFLYFLQLQAFLGFCCSSTAVLHSTPHNVSHYSSNLIRSLLMLSSVLVSTAAAVQPLLHPSLVSTTSTTQPHLHLHPTTSLHPSPGNTVLPAPKAVVTTEPSASAAAQLFLAFIESAVQPLLHSQPKPNP